MLGHFIIQNFMRCYLCSLLPVLQEFCMGDYKIMLLPANHDKREDCMIYVIRDGEKTILYGHDSGMFEADTWKKTGGLQI